MTAATAKKGNPVIMPERMGLAEDKRHDWVVDIPLTVTRDEIFEPAFWAHVSDQMQPMDQIEARWEDGSKILYLTVQMCERNYAKVVLRSELTFDTDISVPTGAEKHVVEWKGPRLQWSVIRVSDSVSLHSGAKSRELAMAWMIDHERNAK